MAAGVERVSWGVRNLSMAIPGPETGGILLVEGGKRAGRMDRRRRDRVQLDLAIRQDG